MIPETTTTPAEVDRCPHCLATLSDFEHFCHACGGPITAHASTDPLGQVYAAGRAYQNATETRKRIVVWGMWLIFGPQAAIAIITCVMLCWLMLNNEETHDTSATTGDLVPLVVILASSVGAFVIYTIILNKVTTSYFEAKAYPKSHPPAPARDMIHADTYWTCPRCSAQVDEQMGCCWQCGATPDGQMDPSFTHEALTQSGADANVPGRPLTRTQLMQRRWFRAWITSWAVGLPAAAMLSAVTLPHSVLQDVLELGTAALVILAVVCPCGFAYWAGRDKNA